VKDMIAAGTPWQTQGRSVSVEDVLDRADGAIGGRFVDQPLTEAAIRHAMGLAYYQMSRHEKARPHLIRAVEQRRQHLGPEHIDTIESMHRLACVLACLGFVNRSDMEAALDLLERVAEVRRRTLGPEHPDTLAAEMDIGCPLIYFDRLGEAQGVFERVSEAQARVLGPENAWTVSSLQGLAQTLRRRGELEKAESLFRRVLDARRRKMGNLHPTTTHALHEFAVLLTDRGKLDEARALYDETLNLNDRLYDQDFASGSGVEGGVDPRPPSPGPDGRPPSALRPTARQSGHRACQARHRLAGEAGSSPKPHGVDVPRPGRPGRGRRRGLRPGWGEGGRADARCGRLLEHLGRRAIPRERLEGRDRGTNEVNGSPQGWRQ